MPGQVLYFAYGSNLPRTRIEARLGEVEVVCTGWLKSHRLCFHKRGGDGSGKCDAHFSGDAQDEVHGALFRLAASQLERLHGIEGTGYECREVVVDTAAGKCGAVTYVALEHAITDNLQPFDWYLALVRQGMREHQLPAWYGDALDAVQAGIDANAARARHHFELISC